MSESLIDENGGPTYNDREAPDDKQRREEKMSVITEDSSVRIVLQDGSVLPISLDRHDPNPLCTICMSNADGDKLVALDLDQAEALFESVLSIIDKRKHRVIKIPFKPEQLLLMDSQHRIIQLDGTGFPMMAFHFQLTEDGEKAAVEAGAHPDLGFTEAKIELDAARSGIAFLELKQATDEYARRLGLIKSEEG